MADNYRNEEDLERVIQTFNPATFLGLPSSLFDKKCDLRYCNNEPLKTVNIWVHQAHVLYS
jgi:hypothetical protein